jgi:hypothetical protein
MTEALGRRYHDTLCRRCTRAPCTADGRRDGVRPRPVAPSHGGGCHSRCGHRAGCDGAGSHNGGWGRLDLAGRSRAPCHTDRGRAVDVARRLRRDRRRGDPHRSPGGRRRLDVRLRGMDWCRASRRRLGGRWSRRARGRVAGRRCRRRGWYCGLELGRLRGRHGRQDRRRRRRRSGLRGTESSVLYRRRSTVVGGWRVVARHDDCIRRNLSSRRQDAGRIDIPLRVLGVPDAEMDVRHALLRLGGGPDRPDAVALGDCRALLGRDRAEMGERHRKPFEGVDRDDLPVSGHGAREADGSRGGCEHRLA